jgi:MFS family permease
LSVSSDRRSARRRTSPLASLRALLDEFPRVVLVLAAGDLVASFGFSLFLPFLTIYLVQTLGASAAQAGLVVAAYSIFSVGSGIAGGWLADRIGRRPVLIGSISCTAILVLSMALATEVWHVALFMLLLGCIDPAFIPAARAAVADTVEEPRRPRAFGLLSVANAIGWIAGPVIGAGLSSFGYPLLFGVSGVLVGCYSVIAFRWLPETRPRAAKPVPEDPAVSRVPDPRGATGRPDPAARLRLRVFAALLPLLAVTHGLTFLWVTTLPIYASVSLGLPTPLWGLLFGLNGLLIVLFQLRIATACERRSKPRVMAAAVSLYAVGLAPVALLSPSTAAVGLAMTIAVVTVGEMLIGPTVAAFVSDLSPVDRRGTYQGIALAAGSIGAGIGPPIAGYVLDQSHGQALWLVAAAILAVVAVGFVVLARWTNRLPTADAPS